MNQLLAGILFLISFNKFQNILAQTPAPAGNVTVNATVNQTKTPESLTISTPMPWVVVAIDKHNFYRSRHRSPPLALNRSIGVISQNYADEIARTAMFDHNPNLQKLGLGENLWMISSSKSGMIPTGDAPITDWYNEIRSYDFKTSEAKVGKTFLDIGHFTQLVWKDSRQIGIAYSIRPSPTYTVYVVANYYPPGNVKGAFKENVLGTANIGISVNNVLLALCVSVWCFMSQCRY